MLEIFRELRGLLRVSHVHIDSWVFRLHYSVTTTCMFAFSLIVSAKQYVGNPIDCIHSKDIPEDVLNTFCWIHSTYTIPSAFWKRIGFDVAHPGVDKTLDPDERRYHKYYQWVCFCLFLQVRWIVPFNYLKYEMSTYTHTYRCLGLIYVHINFLYNDVRSNLGWIKVIIVRHTSSLPKLI